MKAITHTKTIVKPLRFDGCKIIQRTNPDTPPVITEHVRELAIFMRNSNAIVRMPADPLDYKKRRATLYLSTLASLNISSDKYRSISITKTNNAPDTRPMTYFSNWHTEGAFANTDTSEKFHMVIDGKKYKGGLTWFYLREHAPAIDNVNTNDKPAFRHDSLYLFDKLSEDYTA